jgi:hypothetical protein
LAQLYTLHGVQLSGTSGDLEITTRGADNTPKDVQVGRCGDPQLFAPEPVQSVSFSKGAVGILRVSHRDLRAADDGRRRRHVVRRPTPQRRCRRR